MNNKKGVSPLIATVLLIAFAVALGAVVMNWGHGQVQDNTECSKTEFVIEEIGGTANICYEKGIRLPGEESTMNTLHILGSNKGDGTIDNIKLSIITDSGDTLNPSLETSIGPYESKTLSFEYRSNMGAIRKVRIIPSVTINSQSDDAKEVLLCHNGVVEVQSVPICE